MTEQNKKAKKKGFLKRHRKLAIFIKLIFVLIILACIVGAGAIVALFSNDDWAMSKDDLTLKIIDTIMSDQLALFKIFSNILLPSLLFIFSFLTLYHKKLFLYTFYYKFFKK